MCFKDGQIYFTCQDSTDENVIRTVQEGVQQDITCEGAGKIRGIQYHGGYFYVVDKGKERALKCDGDGNIKQKTDSNFLNDSYGIHVDENNVFICSAMDNCVRVLDLELNPLFFIPHIEKPMDITYFKGLYFVISRQQRSGAIVILDIDFHNKKYTSALITNADGNRFGERIRGICANDKYLYVAERGNPSAPQQGGRILCLKYEGMPFPLSLWQKHELRCVSVFTPEENPHLPIDIACGSDNTIYYSAKNTENNEYFVAKLVEHPKGTINGYEVIYP